VPAPLEDVLVISLGVVNDCPGMLHEQKVRGAERMEGGGDGWMIVEVGV
jgi:hypothetical protein